MTSSPPPGGGARRVLRVVHHHPGRLRARAVVFEDQTDAADRVKDELLGEPGILDVQHSARTGSVLVVYEPGQADPNAVLDRIADAAGLDGVIDEVNGDIARVNIRDEVYSGARTTDEVVLELTGGRADLRTVVAGALFAGSIYSFVAQKGEGRFPRWDNLLWWSYGIFTGERRPPITSDSGELQTLAQSLDVFRLDRHRVRIRGAKSGAPETNAILSWLKANDAVVDVAYRESTEAIEVRYEESDRASGAFVRSLSDRVYSMSTPGGVVSMRSEVSHALKGRVRLRLTGVSADDVVRISGWLADLPGVLRASASPAAASVLVLFDPALTTAEVIAEALSATDPATWPKAPDAPKKNGWAATAASAIVLGAAVSGVVPAPVLAVGVALTAIPSAQRAYRALTDRRVSVDVLDLAAVGISLATGQPGTAAFITFLLSVGDRILERTADSARDAISKLMHLDATEAWRVEGDQVVRVDASKLLAGDRVVVEQGGRVAADGVVVSGEASVDEKALTGESLPRAKRAGDRVLAATVVLEGQIVLEVERVGGDTTAAKIVQILEGAGAKPMTLQRATERVTDQLVLPTIGVAAGAALLTGQIARATSVLITDFGTGVRIAVPTSALTAMTLAARAGVLVKGAQYLERLSKADVIIFDKTGTLTCGAPEVLEAIAIGELSIEDVVGLAAGAEARQAHPIAAALRAHATSLGLPMIEPDLGSEVVAVGYGLAARVLEHDVLVGGARWMRRHEIDLDAISAILDRHRARAASSVMVAVDGQLAGVIAYADAPRKESADVVRALRAGGRRSIHLLSGDSRASVEAVAAAVGADAAQWEMLPEDKAAYVKALQAEGHTVAMVGDGINDAPALALADVGISLDGGTDVALETADVVLLEGGLSRLPRAFELGDSAMKSVKRGLALVLAPNAIGIALGALGLLNPAAAAVINNGSTVLAGLAAVSPLFTTRLRRPKRIAS